MKAVLFPSGFGLLKVRGANRDVYIRRAPRMIHIDRIDVQVTRPAADDSIPDAMFFHRPRKFMRKPADAREWILQPDHVKFSAAARAVLMLIATVSSKRSA